MFPHMKLLGEIQRHTWAMTMPSFRAMLSVLEHGSVNEDEARYFHSLATQEKFALASTFGNPVPGASYSSVRGNTGFILLDGPIIPRATIMSQASGLVSLDALTDELTILENDPRVENIVLLHDSPGGAITGVSDFAARVRASDKNTYSYVWSAASASYWIASAADTVVASDTGEVGSIGVVFRTRDFSKLDERRGIRNIEIVSSQSPNKRVDPATPEGRSVYQKTVDDLADVFVSSIAQNRGVSVDTVLADFGGGAMLVAHRALRVGMIDKIESVDTFVNSVVAEPRYSSSSVFGQERISGMNKQQDSSVATAQTVEVTADTLRTQHPSLVAQIESDAVAKERNRVKSIEALSERFAQSPQSIRDSVQAVIDESKYDASKDLADVKMLVADAALNARETMVANHGATFDDTNRAAEAASRARTSATDDPEKAAADRRNEALREAMAAVRGKE